MIAAAPTAPAAAIAAAPTTLVVDPTASADLAATLASTRIATPRLLSQ